MAQRDDRTYFAQRAARQRQIAEASLDKAIAQIHLQLAAEYENMAANAAKTPTSLGLGSRIWCSA